MVLGFGKKVLFQTNQHGFQIIFFFYAQNNYLQLLYWEVKGILLYQEPVEK